MGGCMTPSPPKPCEMSWQRRRSLVFGPTSTHKLPFCAEERDSKKLKPKHPAQYQLEHQLHISAYAACQYLAVERSATERMSLGSTPKAVYPPRQADADADGTGAWAAWHTNEEAERSTPIKRGTEDGSGELADPESDGTPVKRRRAQAGDVQNEKDHVAGVGSSISCPTRAVLLSATAEGLRHLARGPLRDMLSKEVQGYEARDEIAAQFVKVMSEYALVWVMGAILDPGVFAFLMTIFMSTRGGQVLLREIWAWNGSIQQQEGAMIPWGHWRGSPDPGDSTASEVKVCQLFEEARRRPDTLFLAAVRHEGMDDWTMGTEWRGRKEDMPANVVGVNLGKPADKDWAGGDDRVLAHRVMEMELDVLKTLWWVAFGWYSSLVLPSIGDGAPDECLIDAALQRDEPEMALYVIRVTRTARELLQSPKFYWEGALEKILEVAYTKALGDEASGAGGWRPAGVGPRLPLESAGPAASDEAGQFITPASGPLSVAGDSAQGLLQGDGSAERNGDGVLAGNQSRGGPVLEGSTASSTGAGPALAPRALEPSLKGAGGALVAGVAAQGQGAASPVNSVSEGGEPKAAAAASWGMPSNMSAGTMPAAEGQPRFGRRP